MKEITYTFLVTLGFVARKKRKVFRDACVRSDFAEAVMKGMQQDDIKVVTIRFYKDCAAAVTLHEPVGIPPDKVFQMIKKHSRDVMAKHFPKAETIWTRQYWSCADGMEPEKEQDFIAFIERQKGRT